MEGIGKSAVAEFVGTFGLIFIGAGSVIMTSSLLGNTGSGLVGVALAHGLVLAIMVSITAHISGGSINPAVTIALWVTGKMESARAGVYIVAELAGGIAGAYLLRLVMPGSLFDSVHGGTPLVASGLGLGKAVLIEATLTFFLVFSVFGTAVDDRGPFKMTAGLTIGLVIAFDILAGGPMTGAAMNPARALGPELASATFTDWWVYWVGPIAGAIVAGVLYWSVFLRDKAPATP